MCYEDNRIKKQPLMSSLVLIEAPVVYIIFVIFAESLLFRNKFASCLFWKSPEVH